MGEGISEVESIKYESKLHVVEKLPAEFLTACIERGFNEISFEVLNEKELRRAIREASKVEIAHSSESVIERVKKVAEEEGKEVAINEDNGNLEVGDEVVIAIDEGNGKEKGKDSSLFVAVRLAAKL